MEAVIGVDDLISRESLVEKMKHPEIEINDGQDYATWYERCVKTAHTVDAVQVVRCKDCRFSEPFDVFGIAICLQKPCSGHYTTRKEDFCSSGVRKDCEENEID